MRAKQAAAVLESLEQTINNLEALRAPLQLALARDEWPTDSHDRKNDHVSRVVKNVGNKVVAMDIASRSLLNITVDLHKPVDDQAQRQASIPDCIACGQLALPRPKRGLCGVDYERFRQSSYVDIADYIRFIKTEDEAATIASEEAGGPGILDIGLVS